MFRREPVKARMPAKLMTTIMAMLPHRDSLLLYLRFITKKRDGKMKLRGTKPAQPRQRFIWDLIMMSQGMLGQKSNCWQEIKDPTCFFVYSYYCNFYFFFFFFFFK
jgi:hypothetical protein